MWKWPKNCAAWPWAKATRHSRRTFFTRALSMTTTRSNDLPVSCSEVWAFTGNGISKGMQQELSHAREIGKTIVEIHEVE
jgi:hypothetical protein